MLVLSYCNRGVRIAVADAIAFCQRTAVLAVHVEEAIAGGQQVGEVAVAVAPEGTGSAGALGTPEHAAGNLHLAVSHLLHHGRVGAAGDGQGAAGIRAKAHSRAAVTGAVHDDTVGDAAAANGIG